jgi:hypothetical protein
VSECEKFEAWFDEWRRSTWHPLSSDPRKECPEHWNMAAKHHMSIAWQASRRAAIEEAAAVCDRMVSVSAVSYETGSACARDIRALADGDAHG